jgi:hypothetical protein
MADAHWIQLGVHPTFALVASGEIVGITYWVAAEGLAQQAPEHAPLPDSGWYFVSVDRPWEPERVAAGLELGQDMTEEELAQTAEEALEVVANEVLAEGGGG